MIDAALSEPDKIEDAEEWRSTEEGSHFKIEIETGTITSGFGGKYNGKKIGESWGKSKKASSGGSEQASNTVYIQSGSNSGNGVGGGASHFNTESEYRDAQAEADKAFEQKRDYINKQTEEAKAKINRHYDPMFDDVYRRMFDPNIPAEERSSAWNEQDKIANKQAEALNRIDDEAKKLIENAEQQRDLVFDPGYEFTEINGDHDPQPMPEREVVNPNLSQNNCQRCAVAEEMRFRGYDVTTTPGGGDNPAYLEPIARCFAGANTKTFDVQDMYRYNELCQKQMLSWGSGARALCTYTTPLRSHIFNLVNDKGKIRVIDAQTGYVSPKQGESGGYVGIPEEAVFANLIRTDNARLTRNVMKYAQKR